MTTPEENSNNENPQIFYLEQSKDLKDSGLFKYATFNRITDIIEVFVNKINGPINWTLNRKTWTKNFEMFWEQLGEYGIIDNETKLLCRRFLNHNQKEILKDFNNGKSQSAGEGEEEKEEVKLPEIKIYKYSQNGLGDLHEAIILNGIPFFLKYNHVEQKIALVENIEENTRILIPPQGTGDYPYTPYEFESKEEIESYIQKAKTITVDDIYNKCKSIFLKYVDQDKNVIILVTADSIWTYFQDLFATTHYTEGVGANDVGKSSLGFTFEYTGYRVVKGTTISGANYNRILGSVEPGQCVIIEDEGDSMSEDIDKVKILKSGYEYTGQVPKINMNTANQEQKWYKPYCYKMILAEKSLKEYKAKGLVDRTFSFPLGPGTVNRAIKKVVANKQRKNPVLRKLYNELLNYRRLVLCYRILHYNDQLQEIETGLKNRDNELCEPLLQLFYGTKAIDEIIPALETIVKQRRVRRERSLEATLYPILKKYVFQKLGLDSIKDSWEQLKEKKQNIVKVPFYEYVWKDIIGAEGRVKAEIDGHISPENEYEYITSEYGSLYLNSLPRRIAEKFSGDTKKESYGTALIFNIEKLEKYENLYGGDNLKEDSIKITVTPKSDDYDDYDDYYDFLDMRSSFSEKKGEQTTGGEEGEEGEE